MDTINCYRRRAVLRSLVTVLLATLCFMFYYFRSLESKELNFLNISSYAEHVIPGFYQNFSELANTTELNFSNTSPIADSISYRNSIYQKFYKPIKTQENVDCEGIIKGASDSINYAKKNVPSFTRRGPDIEYFINISNCTVFRRDQGYIDHPLSLIERDFPLAFALIVYKNVEQVERLLRSIYRPHNYYCLHIDKKIDNQTKNAFAAIAECFNNVFIVPNPVDVQWENITIVQAELLCMQYLWAVKSWKYYIDLTGQEFPLKTNLEIVMILKSMDGANIAQGQKHRQGALVISLGEGV